LSCGFFDSGHNYPDQWNRRMTLEGEPRQHTASDFLYVVSA